MATITEAEGNASATSDARARIAPVVSQVFDIRNHGGTVYGPTRSSHFSILRRWLGDEPFAWILVDNQQDIPQIQRAFPEAMIAVLPAPNPNTPQPSTGKPAP
jgi:hypothetical protein